jgi:hypothetical protein
MRAFTHLCQKANISLFNDTITLYPKLNGNTHTETVIDYETLSSVCIQVGCVYEEAHEAISPRADRLGIKRFIHRDDPDHAQYHMDKFTMDDMHYHAQFAKTIDKLKLIEILTAFVKYDLLSSAEKESFISAYDLANELEFEALKVASKTVALKTSASPAPAHASKFFASFFATSVTNPLHAKNTTEMISSMCIMLKVLF